MSKLIASLILCLGIGPLMAQQYSKLWGQNGELWNPGAPLQDFSRVAGYHEGKDPFPRWPVKVNIKDFGAKGDGIADDTKAMVDAIKACPAQGAVFIPAGKYKINDWIKISGLRNILISGEDMYETELIISKGLEDLHSSPSMTTSGIPTTSYSWGGGFFWFSNAEELGIENLSFIFPSVTYPGHFKERAYNMISLSGKNNWVQNVRGYNADCGIFVSGSYMTLRNILLDAFPDRTQHDNQARAGHHAIDLQGGQHNLVENYTETVKFIHSLGSEGNTQWNVWHRCKGPDIEIDHHTDGAGMGHNLYTDIDMGKGLGAEGQRRIQTAAVNETFWNLRSTQILPLDASGAGIKQGIPVFPDKIKFIVVGWWLDWPDAEKNKQSASLPWYEYIGNHKDIQPANIYLAQVKKRLGVDNLAPEVRITRPLDLAKYTVGETIKVTAMPDDRDGSVAAVDLIINGTLHSRKTAAPYEWSLSLADKKPYDLVAVVTDDKGAVTTDVVHIGAGVGAGLKGRAKQGYMSGVLPLAGALQATFYSERGADAEFSLYSLPGAKVGSIHKPVVSGWNRIVWDHPPTTGNAPYFLSIKSSSGSQVFPFVNPR